MAEGDQTAAPAKAAPAEEKAAKPVSEDPTIPVERLVAEADAFLGVAPAVAAGALSTESKKSLTVEDAKASVDAWLKKEVEVDDEEARAS